MITDYRWMKREVSRLEELLGGTSRYSSAKSEGVAQYGDEAGMPKGSGLISKAELDNLDYREQKILIRIKKYKNTIEFVEVGEEYIEEPVQQVIYSCMMEGMSYRTISKHIGMSKDKIRQLRDELITQLSQNSHFRQNLHYLKYKKQTVYDGVENELT